MASSWLLHPFQNVTNVNGKCKFSLKVLKFYISGNSFVTLFNCKKDYAYRYHSSLEVPLYKRMEKYGVFLG